MKIIIEHETFNATTSSLLVAQRLLDIIRMLEDEPKTAIKEYKDIPIYQDISEVPTPKKASNIDIFDTKDTKDIPEKVLPKKKSKILKTSFQFNPDWIEHEIDFTKQQIVRYSNPCSTLHGHNGGKVWMTELMLIDNSGAITTCDCEFTDIDELNNTLNAIVKPIDISEPDNKTEQATQKKAVCSMGRLQEVADLFNRGCNNKQVAEILGIALTSTSKYKNEAKKAGLLK